MSLKTNRSIARRINVSLWAREAAHIVLIDAGLVGAVFTSFFLWCEAALPETAVVLDRQLTDAGSSWQYILITTEGALSHDLTAYLTAWKIPCIVVLVLEGLLLLYSLLSSGHVRRLLAPLHQVALKAEALSQQGLDPQRVEKMEQAVSQVDPNAPGAYVTTGDKELKSLEVAVNNLLDRMRESRSQQARFISDASHELRTPIAVIQGYVNMLDRWGKEDEQILRESIEALQNESEHMKVLVEQLLFLARGDNGRQTLHMTPVYVTDMVREVMEESAMIDEAHRYRMLPENKAGGTAVTGGNATTEEPGGTAVTGPVMAYGDVAMLKQALRIFVENAAKYSEPGSTITFRAGQADGRPYFSVQDEGRGMDGSEAPHIFERFFRGDEARSAAGGTGLGLSIAKWIVDSHGGVIEVLSQRTLGTRITVRLLAANEGVTC